jgi:hypothetical protein
MAAPNIVGVSSIYGRTAGLTPANTTANVLLANPASSNKVFKINLIMAANINGSSDVDTTVAWNTTATGNGTSFAIISTASVPADASLIVVDKSTTFYLEENESILVTSGTSGQIAYTVSYEEIS